MSLSQFLRKPTSPVRVFLENVSPYIARQSQSKISMPGAAALGFKEITSAPLLVPTPDGSDRSVSGTAFDIRTRMALGGFSPDSSASYAGVSWICDVSYAIQNGSHRAGILSEVFELAKSLLLEAASEAHLDLAAVLFAYCEHAYRSGVFALQGKLGEACDLASDAQTFAENVDEGILKDIRQLMNANTRQLDEWKIKIDEGANFEVEPYLSGSNLVGGADADWLIGTTLIDCKVYGRLANHKLRDFLMQLLGYVMLDLNDDLNIRQIGLWLPRQRLTPTWDLEFVLGGDPEIVLPRLRKEFIKATKSKPSATPAPLSDEQILQQASEEDKPWLLADSPTTSPELLEELGRSEIPDIRSRVGRNSNTPSATLLRLSKDRSNLVRKGVAMNKNTTFEILDMLSLDSSAVVRRAASSNPNYIAKTK